ncbi:MAG: DUF1576 domain-containing protein [Clostridiales bacterium]|nr:DUF1576 domain-containing protein [Clostridiales bacterium]
MDTEHRTCRYTNSQIINGIAFGFSAALLLAAAAAAFYKDEWRYLFYNWYRIMVTPGPLVTDYFAIGGLAATFLNAGACGMACFLAMILLKGDSRANTLAGYFLVVAHCFYGLNFLNMWPCFLAPFLYLRVKKLNFKSNLQVCMFTTSFAPFISELLFRYTQGDDFRFGFSHLTLQGILLTILFSLMLGFIVPAILPGANAWHKGYNLYNGGLAFGIFGFFVYNFLYKTMGVPAPTLIPLDNINYTNVRHNYRLFANCFYSLLFIICIAVGYHLNGKSAKGVSHLFRDTGFRSDFAEKYGMPICLMNIGIYGFFFLLYLNIVILYTNGAGFTGPTFGIILAALTFTSMGQHPRNIWPILLGYQLLYLITLIYCSFNGREVAWSVSTQGYMNGIAFATGMSPIVGRYGRRAGVVAGLLCGFMCTATSAIHGGLVLYNGGFTAGLTVLILLPILEHYIPDTRDTIEANQYFNFNDMIAINETIEEGMSSWDRDNLE